MWLSVPKLKIDVYKRQYGNYDPSTMVDVEVLPEEVPAPQPEPEVETEQEMITQTEEETVEMCIRDRPCTQRVNGSNPLFSTPIPQPNRLACNQTIFDMMYRKK